MDRPWLPCLGRELSVRPFVGTAPWFVSDELWDRLEPFLPQRERRFRYPGRKPLPDRDVLCGILYVLHTGIQCEYLPQDLGFGCGTGMKLASGNAFTRSCSLS